MWSRHTHYELWNRLWTPALLGMLLGFSGFYLAMSTLLTRVDRGGLIAFLTGLVLMVIGNISEFWIFTGMPYEGDGSFIRNASWMTFLIGTLIMLIASMVADLAMLLHITGVLRWLSLLFVLLLPLTVACGFLNTSLLAIPLGGLSIVTGSFVLLFPNPDRRLTRPGRQDVLQHTVGPDMEAIQEEVGH